MIPLAPAEINTHSLHDALPIFVDRPDTAEGDADLTRLEHHRVLAAAVLAAGEERRSLLSLGGRGLGRRRDRKSTRLNSSHGYISYAVFCLKKESTLSAA